MLMKTESFELYASMGQCRRPRVSRLAGRAFGFGLVPALCIVQNAGAAVAVFSSYDNDTAGLDWLERSPMISDASYQDAGFSDLSDDQRTRWARLLQSGNAYASVTSLTRAFDVVEDYDINWSTPNFDLGINSRWEAVDTNGFSSFTISNWNQAGASGPFAGEYWRGNQSIIATGDDKLLFWNQDQQRFTLYHLNGGLISNDGGLGSYGWAAFSGGGAYDGLALSASVIKDGFVGFEENAVAFLDGEDSLVYYSVTNGVFIRTQDYSGVTAGPLAGDVTVADVIDGKVPDTFWVGLDTGPLIANVPIPEPSATLLLSAGLAAMLVRRRR